MPDRCHASDVAEVPLLAPTLAWTTPSTGMPKPFHIDLKEVYRLYDESYETNRLQLQCNIYQRMNYTYDGCRKIVDYWIRKGAISIVGEQVIYNYERQRRTDGAPT